MKRLKKEFNQIVNNKLLIIILIFLLVCSVTNIGKSIQTIDTVHNFFRVGTQLGIDPENITDIGSDFQERKLCDYYITGMNDLRKNIVFSIFLSLTIGYLIGIQNGTNKTKVRKNRRKN